MNALHLAASNGHLDVVKYLIPRFAEDKFNKTDKGNTCLDLAIQKKKQDVVDYLLLEGGFALQQH